MKPRALILPATDAATEPIRRSRLRIAIIAEVLWVVMASIR
jgi:hypothetical protein